MKKVLVCIFTIIYAFYPLSIRAEDNPVVAKIGDKKITASDLDHMIQLLDKQKKEFLRNNPEMKKTFLQRWVKTTVISKIARKERFDERPDIKEFIEFIINDYIASEYLNRILKEEDLTEKDVKLYYDTHVDEFKAPELVKAKHILIKVTRNATEEERNKARERAQEILKRIKSGEPFDKLAQEFSDDIKTKERGGDLGYIRKGMMIPSFEKALFELKTGEVSDIVESPFGFHIIKVDEKKGGEIEPFDKVKDVARKKAVEKLRNAKASDFVEKALKDAGVEFYFDSIPGIKGDTHK